MIFWGVDTQIRSFCLCMCVWRYHTQLLSYWSHFARSVASEIQEQIWTLCALFGSEFQLYTMQRVALGLVQRLYSPYREVMAEPPLVVFLLTVCGSFKYQQLPATRFKFLRGWVFKCCPFFHPTGNAFSCSFPAKGTKAI